MDMNKPPKKPSIKLILSALVTILVIAMFATPDKADVAVATSGAEHSASCGEGCSHVGGHSGFAEMLAQNEERTRARLYTKLPENRAGLQLIKAVQGESDWKGQIGGAIRAHEVALDETFMKPAPFKKGEVLTLNLFDDVSIDTVVYESFENVNGTISTTARVADTLFGRAVIALTDNELRVKVVLPESNEIYAVHYNHRNGSHYALELDPAIVDADGCETVEGTIYADPPKVAAGPEADVGPPGSPPSYVIDESKTLVVIDAMVVYPENVVTSAGSETNVKNIAAQGIALANDAHITTDTGMYINLVHTALFVGYTDTGSKGTDLDRLTYSPGPYYTFDPWNDDPSGYMDEVHQWRDDYGADFVHMMHSTSGGLGWRPNFASTSSGDPEYGFSITGWTSFSSYTPGHEMGHNMNLSHAKGQTSNPGTPTDPTGTDAAGWRWLPDGAGTAGFCSVMSYENYPGEPSHTRLGLFSDPNIIDRGVPAGDVDDGNNARVLRAYKNIYANYRTRPQSANSILVENANGGEVYAHGEAAEFVWNSNGVTGDIKVELYRNGSFEKEVASATINDRIFYYMLPSDLTTSSLYKLRVSSVNSPSVEDYSDANFTIGEVIYGSDLNSNPGFTATGSWEYGAPFGDNPTYGGPSQAYTGTNIYDTNLDGVSGTTSYLTTPAIDCSGHTNITLKFAGWFSVTSGYEAKVEVSNNGTSWTQLSSVSDISVDAWSEYTYDISTVANEKSTVYVRWAHKNNSGGGNYSGMSVDDVSIIGVAVPTPFETWSGGSASNVDSNGDGIANGVAWVLGASGPNVDATSLKPTIDNDSDPDYLIFTHRRSDTALADSNTTINVEYGSNLSGWTTAVHDNNNVVISTTDDHYGAGIDRVQVKLKKTLASGGKLFSRLKVQVTE